MNTKRALLICSAVAALLFFYNVKRAADLRRDYAELKAEVSERTSVTSLMGATVRSFFDGLTLGVLSDEGIFTESKKMERWSLDAAKREARIKADYSDAITYRLWSLIAATGFLIAFVYFDKRADRRFPLPNGQRQQT